MISSTRYKAKEIVTRVDRVQLGDAGDDGSIACKGIFLFVTVHVQSSLKTLFSLAAPRRHNDGPQPVLRHVSRGLPQLIAARFAATWMVRHILTLRDAGAL